jgi:hypothetical protein
MFRSLAHGDSQLREDENMTAELKPDNYQDTGAVAWTATPDAMFSEDWAEILESHMDRLMDEAGTGTVDADGDEMVENRVLGFCAYFVVSNFLQIVNFINPIQPMDITAWQRSLATAIHEDVDEICDLDVLDDEPKSREIGPDPTIGEIASYNAIAARLTNKLSYDVIERLGYSSMECALAISCAAFRQIWGVQISISGVGKEVTEMALDELVSEALPGLTRPPDPSAMLH